MADMAANDELIARIDAAERRLAVLAEADRPGGLTDPDEGGTERWEAGQVWAHIGEFVPYWHRQMRVVIDAYPGTPASFGRTRTDPGRISSIEANRDVPIAQQMSGTHAAIVDFVSYASSLTPEEWSAVGLHPVRGEMTAHDIAERFIVDHLEEHADQLDRLQPS
ncbi:MAG TPA: hypothetical protein VH371_11755 [Candidatus Limnocylindrales bacterium]|jgi:hypothetical protein